MRALLASAAALLALAGPVALTPRASAENTTLKAVIFEEVKPLYQKTDAGYEGLGVDVLEQIRIQAKRRKVDYRVAKSVNDGISAVITGKADIACGVAFTWGRSTQVTYSLPFGIGGTRLLMASDTTVDGTPASSETNACRFGTHIPTQVLLERFEEGPPLTPLTPNPSGA